MVPLIVYHLQDPDSQCPSFRPVFAPSSFDLSDLDELAELLVRVGECLDDWFVLFRAEPLEFLADAQGRRHPRLQG